MVHRTKPENRTEYLVNEKGAYEKENQHYASYRPIVQYMLSEKLELAGLSNTQFYNKLVCEIRGDYRSDALETGVNRRYYKAVVGGQRNLENLTWSAPLPETACTRPFLNLGPLCSSSPAVLVSRIERGVVSCCFLR